MLMVAANGVLCGRFSSAVRECNDSLEFFGLTTRKFAPNGSAMPDLPVAAHSL